jgi:hypothetical protein
MTSKQAARFFGRAPDVRLSLTSLMKPRSSLSRSPFEDIGRAPEASVILCERRGRRFESDRHRNDGVAQWLERLNPDLRPYVRPAAFEGFHDRLVYEAEPQRLGYLDKAGSTPATVPTGP